MSIRNNAQKPDLLGHNVQGPVVLMFESVSRGIEVVKVQSAIGVFLKKSKDYGDNQARPALKLPTKRLVAKTRGYRNRCRKRLVHRGLVHASMSRLRNLLCLSSMKQCAAPKDPMRMSGVETPSGG
jgi:hypothetical protein